MDIVHIVQETATWIAKCNSDFETNMFRSPELSPGHFFPEIDDDDRPKAVDQIISIRSELLSRSETPLIAVPELLNYGRVMYFDAISTTCDGAPEDVSAGYVDIADTPPWDTWLSLGQQLNTINFFKIGFELPNDFLVAWVPESHYYFANVALEVAPLDNFEWPKDGSVAEEFEMLRSLFQKPVQIDNPEKNTNTWNSLDRLKRINVELLANSEKYYAKLFDRSQNDNNNSSPRKRFWFW